MEDYGDTQVGEAKESLYRGGKIVKADAPLYLHFSQESDWKGEVGKLKSVINPETNKEIIYLDKIINNPSNNQLFDDFNKHTRFGVGFAPCGRLLLKYKFPTQTDLDKDAEKIKIIMKYILKSKASKDTQEEINLKIPQDYKGLFYGYLPPKEEIENLGFIGTYRYALERFLQTTLSRSKNEWVNLDWFNDLGISRLYQDKKESRYQGVFYIKEIELEGKIKRILYWSDTKSTFGSICQLPMKNTAKILEELEKELMRDELEGKLGKEAHNYFKSLEEDFKEGKEVKDIRSLVKNPTENKMYRAFGHIPLFNINDERQIAVIYIGSPRIKGYDIPKNIMTVSNFLLSTNGEQK